MRDLGVDGFQHALAAFAAGGGDAVEPVPRAHFYARVRALEDLSFGLEQHAPAYRDNALRAIDELYAPGRERTRAIDPKRTTLDRVTDRCTHGVRQGGSTDGHMIAARAIG